MCVVQAAAAEGQGLVSVRVSDMRHSDDRPYQVDGSDTAEDTYAFVVSIFFALAAVFVQIPAHLVQSKAMSAFSPVGSWFSNGMSMCVCVCVCKCVCVCVNVHVCLCMWNEHEVCTTLVYPHISSFRTMPVYTHKHTLTNASSYHLRTANRRG